MKIKKIKFYLLILLFAIFYSDKAHALTPGALLYRTSNDGKMYGYSTNYLLEIQNGILRHIYPGHVGIYIGQENGEHYVVEALADGIVKTPAKYFVNESLGEKFLGARVPKEATPSQLLKAVMIAKNLANSNLGYDFSFQKQKGASDGDWTCVGLVEKIYESSEIINPNNINSLEYDSDYYAIDITPDGFDDYSYINDEGDCFSSSKEFSKISRRENLILPLPEKIGFNAGREYKGERYFFVPYTQFLQDTLRDEPVDIGISSSFKDKKIRGKTPIIGLMLRWSLVNNPMSSIKNGISKIAQSVRSVTEKIFSNDKDLDIVQLQNDDSSDLVVQPASNSAVINKNLGSEISNNDDDQEILDGLEISSNKSSQESKITVNNKAMTTQENEIDDIFSNQDLVKVITTQSNEKTDALSGNYQINQTPEDVLSRVISKQVENKNNVIIEEIENVIHQESDIEIGQAPNNVDLNITQNKISPNFTPTVLISKIYATGMNDFVELYNPTNYDFDLAESGFRLEKTKTADNPSIAVRIGDEGDAIYPGGTIIPAKGYYLLVRDDASNYFLSRADAIVKRNEFGWTGNSYTLYVGKGAISSSSDSDIIDAVGFGGATYFRGNNTAPEILDNYFLNRIDFNNDNSLDFELAASSDPEIVWDDYLEDTESGDDNTNDQENENENESDDSNENNEIEDEENNQEENNNDNASNDIDGSSDFTSFVFPNPIIAEGVSGLWHFSECYGSNTYSVGRFDCAIELGTKYQQFIPELSQNIDLNNFSISFYYRDSTFASSRTPRLKLSLKNEENQSMKLELQPDLLQIEGLPNSEWRYYNAPVFMGDDFSWQYFTLVVSEEENYWAVYFNGTETYRHEFIENLPNNFSYLEIMGDMGAVSLDELVLWNKALSQEEINNHLQAQAPFSPVIPRSNQKVPSLKYFWDFNEGVEFINSGGGNEALDSVSSLKLNLGNNIWIWRGEDNTGIRSKWEEDILVEFNDDFSGKDMSLAFWWRNHDEDDGRVLISLRHNNDDKFGFAPSRFRRSFIFNGLYGIFSEGNDLDLPYDNLWHHFVFTYDSYRYQLKMYIDGQEKKSFPFVWIKDGEEPNNLLIKSELNSVELDDVGIWEGALSGQQVANLFQQTLAQ
jgi:hypothetical protein